MVSLRKNEEEQKMQGIRVDVRSAFYATGKRCKGWKL